VAELVGQPPHPLGAVSCLWRLPIARRGRAARRIAMRRPVLCLLLVVVCGLLPERAAAQERHALVIGNSAYVHPVPRLRNPANDAKDMAALLSRLGFRVWLGLDLKRNEMEDIVQSFSEALIGNSIGLFFFAGHGVNIDGRNYLLPVDAGLSTAQELERGLIDLALVQGRMELATQTNILFIDACRDNPLPEALAKAAARNPQRIGIGLLPQRPTGTLVAYSTQPGTQALDGEGRNSPYAEALLKHLGTPGQDLAAVLARVQADVRKATSGRQVPWDLAKLVAPIAIDTKGRQGAVKPMRGGLGDRQIADIIENALAMVPPTLHRPNGTVIRFDRKNRASIVMPVDVVRDVAFAGRRSAYAQVCALPDYVQRNYEALVRRIKASVAVTEQQAFFLTMVHRYVVALLSGNITITGAGGKDVVKFQPPSCDDRMKAYAMRVIDSYAAGR
jgi:hypothetical protein